MNSKQIALVRKTCSDVAPVADSTAEVFYQKLFQLNPALRPVFAGHLHERGRHLLETVEAAARVTDKPDLLASVMADLDNHQIASAAGDRRYEAIGAALILAFRQGLGPAFTPDARQAWIALFDYIDGTMKAKTRQCVNSSSHPEFGAAA